VHEQLARMKTLFKTMTPSPIAQTSLTTMHFFQITQIYNVGQFSCCFFVGGLF